MMPLDKSISFRERLLSSSMELLAEVNINSAKTAKLISGIVSKLAAYTEEGAPLSPEVFICNSASDLVKRAGAGEFVPLSEVYPADFDASKILKTTAPLCSENWRIFVEHLDGGDKCRFGVFCGSSDPTSASLDEVLLSIPEPGFPIVKIAQGATNKVLVSTNAGNAIEFRFNDDVDVDLVKMNSISELSKQIASKVSFQPDRFGAFVTRVLATAVRRCHGTLVAVTHPTTVGLPAILKDAVNLEPSLDLVERFRLHSEENMTASSVSRLQAAAELLSGFVCSDGITVFSTTGQVLAYRAFVKNDGPDQPSQGGARTRAFKALEAAVGTSLQAAFFRSQDGRTDFKAAKPEIPNE
jgi:hypothetical protein